VKWDSGTAMRVVSAPAATLVASETTSAVQTLHDHIYAVHHGLAPTYITKLMTSTAAQTSRPRLGSADTTSYVQPRIRTKVGELAFSHAGPAAWNSIADRINFDKHLFSTASNATSRPSF